MSDRIIRSRTDALFDTGVYAIMIAFSAIFLYPVIYAISSSFSGAEALLHQEVWLWPVDVTLKSYQLVFEHEYVLPSYGNTILYTVLGTTYSVLLTILGAYPLSRSYLPFRDFFMLIIAFTMLFGGGLIPTYMVIRSLGFINTRWAIIVPALMNAYYIIVMKSAFEQLPGAYEESAKLDGEGPVRILFQILLPLVKPTLVVIIMFSVIGQWNSWYPASIYLPRVREKWPLQLIMRSLLIQNDVSKLLTSSSEANHVVNMTGNLVKYAVTIVGTLPILVAYPFAQRYFVTGITLGGVKG